MSNNDGQAQKVFLLGTIVLSILIVGGIVWAIMAGPSQDSGGSAETNLSFSDDNDPAVGPGESKAAVHIFGDLQCPGCRSAEPGVSYAMKTYGDKVRFVWNDFPLTTVHPNAMAAAVAARCAEEQGKFWEFRTMAYDKQPEWEGLPATTDTFSKYAASLGMKTEDFTSCIATRKYINKVEDDMAEGRSNNVQATPTFFIGNKRFEGGLSNAQWDQEIQELLKKS